MSQSVLAKITLRLIPYLFLLYLVAYLDRVNVGFAALQMNRDLGFDEAIFGFGSGIFFLGYMLFQVPANLLVHRFGARRLISALMLIWGCLSMSTMMITTPMGFYVLRFCLGLAEAGFFPGVVLYLTYWFPAQNRAQAVSLFMAATAVSGVLGGPISGFLLTLKGGLAGWQWLFLIEGLPAMGLGLVTYFYLPDRPAQALWLEPAEREWLVERLAQENHEKAPATLLDGLLSGRVWFLSFIYFSIVSSMYSVTMWLPQIIKSLAGFSDFTVGLLSALPYFTAALGMVVVGRHSDFSGERRWHVAISAWVGALGLVGAGLLYRYPILDLAALSLAALGIWSTMGCFWALPTTMLRGSAAATGIAIINSLGNLGGFGGPYGVGLLKQYTESFALPLFCLAALIALGGLLVLNFRSSSIVQD